MKNDFSTAKSYKELVKEIKKVSPRFFKSKNSPQNSQELLELWQTGKKIDTIREKMSYGEKDGLLGLLAKDTQLSRTDLYDLSKLYTAFEKGLPTKMANFESLTWTHFRELTRIEDPKARNFYLKYSAAEGLTTRLLQLSVRSQIYEREMRASKEHPHGEIIVERNGIYVFLATLEEILDGDTIVCLVDQGFFNRRHLRGRLRGINCSELKGPNQKLALKAKSYNQKQLGELEFFVIKSYKVDSFGRFVIDVFYHPVWKDPVKILTKGYYINQELLDLGLAKLSPF